MIQKILGDFRDDIPETHHEYLKLGFSPSSLSVQQRWRTNGLSADFVADYLTTFLRVYDTGGQDDDSDARDHEIKDAVSFIANELLENAMKFNYEPVDQPIQFNLHLLPEASAVVLLSVTNGISEAGMGKLQSFIREFLATDPDDFYTRQLEKAAAGATASGRGFITIRNDYSGRLGWKFEQSSSDLSPITVTTMVQLTLQN